MILTFSLFVGSLILTIHAQAQVTYPLTCVFNGKQTIGVNPHNADYRRSIVGFTFTPGTKAATLGVEPGTCAWQDRGMRADEPIGVYAIISTGWNYITFRPASGNSNIFTSAPISAPWVPQAYFPGYQITFNVYRSEPSEGIAVPYFRIK
jgi:hypothetical protein